MTDAKPRHRTAPQPQFQPQPSLIDRVGGAAEANPLALVAGGLALGVVLGALLPRSERERQLLAPVGEKLGASVTAALDAAKEAGKAELADAGIGRDAARDQVRNLVDGLLKAASSAGSAAAQAAASASTSASNSAG